MFFNKKDNKQKLVQEDAQRKLIVRRKPQSPISEQYRTIRTNIEFLEVHEALKVLMVSSTKPMEGKSLTAANLGAAFAHQGKKVLLIDADLRKPTLHHYFGITNSVGVTNVLAKQADLLKSVVRIKGDPLSILASGPIPPNPAELLGSPAMEKLISQAKEAYDVIILDTPPLLAVADAQIVAKHTDGAILVVASGKTEAEQAKKAKEMVESTGTRLLGAVLNQQKEKRKRHDGYYERN
ncbi:MAG: CpsD/CapB family tyrosine-protein kinase [Bacillus sp. (in: firmicutes)]